MRTAMMYNKHFFLANDTGRHFYNYSIRVPWCVCKILKKKIMTKKTFFSL